MRKVLLGVALIAFMIILVGISAQNKKTKTEAPKTETTKTEAPKSVATCCSAPSTETAKVATCCSAPSTETAKVATCCSAPSTETAKVATCCSAPSTETATANQETACSKSDEKKDCCQVEKMIAEKKTEAKMKK